jgi:hypothetical protein
MKFNITWEGDIPELTEDEKLHLAREIVWLEQSMPDPSDLIFHMINLTKDPEGPSIVAYGKPDNRGELFLEYNAVTQYITLDDIDDVS